jgi:hypothetical protein
VQIQPGIFYFQSLLLTNFKAVAASFSAGSAVFISVCKPEKQLSQQLLSGK